VRIALAIWRREVAGFLSSPIAYVVLGAFAFLYGYFFSDYLASFVEAGMRMTRMGGLGGGGLNVNGDLIRWLMTSIGILTLFLMPLVTMRSFAGELRSGTIELLLTAPISDTQIALGKFFAALTLYAAMLGITLLHLSVLFWFSMPDWAPIFAGYLGLFLIGAGFAAIGIFFSSLTRNQIVAALLTFGALLVLWLLEFAGQSGGAGGQFLAYLSVTGHLDGFARGVIATRDLVFFVLFAAFWLVLTRESLRARRWRG